MRLRRAHAGFTLIEVLLALGMISMVAMALYSCLSISFKARRTATTAMIPVRTCQVTMDLIRQDLENALPPNGVLAGPFIGQSQLTSGGPGDDVQFCCMTMATQAASDDPTQAGGISRVELAVESTQDGSLPVLVRRITRNLLAPVAVDPDEEIICRNVKSFLVRYYDGSTWQDQWDTSMQTLPNAVEVTLELQVPTGNAEPKDYRMTRVFTLACHDDATEASSNL